MATLAIWALIIASLIAVPLTCKGQGAAVEGTVFRSRVFDTLSVKKPNGFGALFYSPQKGKWIAIENGQQKDLITDSYSKSATEEKFVQKSDNVFTEDVTLVLSEGKTFGRYVDGQTAAWTGLTPKQAILDAAVEYVDPIFNTFSIMNQPPIVEVGTTISGALNFTWSIARKSGLVFTIDIFDNISNTALVSFTPNDKFEPVTVSARKLNVDGAICSFKGIGHNISPEGDIYSADFNIVARFLKFYGATSSTVTTSAGVRALPKSEFHQGLGSFILDTGSSLTKFVCALPSNSILSVVDLDTMGLDITSEYVLVRTISVPDAGGTLRSYKIYEMNIAAPYSKSHRHQIFTN